MAREFAAQCGVVVNGDALDKLGGFAELTLNWNRIVNLTSAKTPQNFLAEHIVDGLAVAGLIPSGRAADLGSGAGIPGLVLAIVDGERECLLIEPRAKRARFLRQVAIELALPNVEVVNLRAQEHRAEVPYPTIICRAFGTLKAFVDAAEHLGDSSTQLFALKGDRARFETELSELDGWEYEVTELAHPRAHRRSLVSLRRF
ncbi:MAG: 16S rRNA (guanine(527)-N(7))-methyltransferase RsmG [Pseudomonadota bacterium]